MKNDYVVRAKKFLEELIPLFPDESGSARKNVGKVRIALNKFKAKYPRRDVLLCNGAVRYVLITSDYVIKWDYNANNAEEYGGCAKESKVWNRVKNSSYAYLFAPITRITVGGHYWYVMPRIRGRNYHLMAFPFLSPEEKKFLSDNNICDLHSGNYRIVKKKVKIFDYACGW